ncbi:uracil-DNA glycosylase [Carnobacterium gallinarum]|uniref:uracil-DNA glycosylase n=1 Tax=Carnobacterium gallinarum TaxID=2749 RepID=UPI00054D609B|nr:uracil-DNA glycosylase [Carnobacterium gallinarum]
MKEWNEFFEVEQKEPYFIELMKKVDEASTLGPVYPPREEMFSCFDWCSYEDIKVVILGQDPYHGKNQAHGLSFSVKPGEKIPPSLRNIYKELDSDLGIPPANHGYLVAWAKQGILMMNTGWSVAEGQAASHKKFGWKQFTNHVLEELNNHEEPLVFILWGNHAMDAAKGIVTDPKHLIIKGVHPSPLAARGGFFGSKPFSEANAFLEKTGRGAINWQLEDI